jgi:uncharacterized delta-60 repeat protein
LQTHRPVHRLRPHLEVLEDHSLLSGGVLDPTFGTGGVVTTAIGSSSSANAVTTYPQAGTANDGKVVVAGLSDVLRYNLDGTLDRSFGGSGVVTIKSQSTEDVAVQLDGKVVAAGTSGSANYNFAVVRYNADGSLDTSFGGKTGKGLVSTDINQRSWDFGERIALQADGKIVVAGYTTPYNTNVGTICDLALVRYNADGSLDTTFGSGGIVVRHFASPLYEASGSLGLDMAIDPGSSALDPNAGKIVVAARLENSLNGSRTVVARFNTNGSSDSSFGGGAGYVTVGTVDIGVSVTVQSDDRIVVAVTNGGLTRLNPDGTPDLTFGAGGTAPQPSVLQFKSVTTQPDGQILVAGAAMDVARYNRDGSLDTSFGVNGVAYATGVQASSALVPVDLALEPDGRIIVAGTIGSSAGIALARFLAAGPQIGSFTASPNPVTAGSSLTLTASNIVDFNPNSSVTHIAFYQDSNGDGKLDAGDTMLGYATQASPGVWTFPWVVSLAPGTDTLFAQAEDTYGAFGDPVGLPLTVQ